MGVKNVKRDVFKHINMHGGDNSICWEWTGTTTGRPKDRRGVIQVDGVRYLAYRLVFELVNGEILDGNIVRHSCDNTLCCNPTHLIQGTLADNQRDRVVRDRWAGRFNMGVAREIRQKYKDGSFIAKLAREYNCDNAIISRIVHNHTYKEIVDD